MIPLAQTIKRISSEMRFIVCAELDEDNIVNAALLVQFRGSLRESRDIPGTS